MELSALQPIFNAIMNILAIVVVLAGGAYGVIKIWDDLTGDQPGVKKGGILILVASIVIGAAIFLLKGTLWSTVTSLLTTGMIPMLF